LLALPILAAAITCSCGFFTLQPNEAAALLLSAFLHVGAQEAGFNFASAMKSAREARLRQN
jgi:hypothetical protein